MWAVVPGQTDGWPRQARTSLERKLKVSQTIVDVLLDCTMRPLELSKVRPAQPFNSGEVPWSSLDMAKLKRGRSQRFRSKAMVDVYYL